MRGIFEEYENTYSLIEYHIIECFIDRTKNVYKYAFNIKNMIDYNRVVLSYLLWIK